METIGLQLLNTRISERILPAFGSLHTGEKGKTCPNSATCPPLTIERKNLPSHHHRFLLHAGPMKHFFFFLALVHLPLSSFLLYVRASITIQYL